MAFDAVDVTPAPLGKGDRYDQRIKDKTLLDLTGFKGLLLGSGAMQRSYETATSIVA